jgi:putative aldouronate transport system permease protein
MKSSRGYQLFDVINYLLLLCVIGVIVFPLLYILSASFSNPVKVAAGEIFLVPKGFTLEAYRNVFSNKEIWVGYRNSFFYTGIGTLINLGVTLTAAFALSRRMLPLRNVIMGLFVVTMFFSGGLIPTYILVKKLGMIDTPWALLIPGALSVYNLIITRTFFQTSIPEELYESARMDGCSDTGMFLRIALPLSAPIVAVMALFYGVGHWNQFFNAMIYLNNRELFPLQLVLRNILIMNQELNMDISSMTGDALETIAKRSYMAEVMKYALIYISSLPVLLAYPFIQRYFVKGVMVGAIKG